MHGVAIMAMIALQGGPFLPAFLLELGGSNYEIGLLTTIAFLSQAMQIPGLALVQRSPKRKAITAFSALAYRICWLLMAAVPVYFVGGGVRLVLGIMLLSELVSALSGPAWSSLLREIVPDQVRGQVMARRMALGTLASLAATILGGWFLDCWKLAHPDKVAMGHSALFVVGVLLGFVGLYLVLQLPERTLEPTPEAPLLSLMKKPLQDVNFRNLLAFAAAWNLAVNLASPFFIVYLMKRLDLGLGMATTLTVVSQVANLLFLRLWGRLADRTSNKSVLALACPLFLLAVLAWVFTTMPGPHSGTVPRLYGIYLLSGMSMAGVSVASTNIALELSALDFVFLASFLMGFYALHRLSLVKEEGEDLD
jgi:MFS family permease